MNQKFLIKFIVFIKNSTLFLKPHILFGWLSHSLMTISNTLKMSKFISRQDRKNIFNDYFSLKRDHDKRLNLYQYVVDKFNLNENEIIYLEFGVSKGYSFSWWLSHISNQGSKFYGFDTFEGLPEDWGVFKKGEMDAEIPSTNDNRANFIKGLFQDTLPSFLKKNDFNKTRKVIHMDADLFTSTLYVLTSLAPFLNKDDIIFFDEFNVPNHEFQAFKIFCDSYYIKTKLLGAVNNYYQTAFIII